MGYEAWRTELTRRGIHRSDLPLPRLGAGVRIGDFSPKWPALPIFRERRLPGVTDGGGLQRAKGGQC